MADETWHPRQKSGYDGEHCVLEVPYADHRELVMDILKHGPEVEVLAPDALKVEVVSSLNKALLRQKKIGIEKQRRASKNDIKQKKIKICQAHVLSLAFGRM